MRAHQHTFGPCVNKVLLSLLLLQYCPKGSLEKALKQGKMKRPDRQPDMVRGTATSWHVQLHMRFAAVCAGAARSTLAIVPRCRAGADMHRRTAHLPEQQQPASGVVLSPFVPLSSQPTILKVLLDIASGLDYLHSIGVVHGDLKTANVLLKGRQDQRGICCKITDFGALVQLELGLGPAGVLRAAERGATWATVEAEHASLPLCSHVLLRLLRSASVACRDVKGPGYERQPHQHRHTR
jgi:hypothetical protein